MQTIQTLNTFKDSQKTLYSKIKIIKPMIDSHAVFSTQPFKKIS